jgi:hypothetical protein
MSPGEFYNELKGWQTGISSIFGFGALILAALYNFKLNRRRDSALRSDEALSVATALYGEILLLRKELEFIAKLIANDKINKRIVFNEDFLEAHPLSGPLLYKALAPKIGLLSPDLIIGITEFHRDFQEAKLSLPLIVDSPGRNYSVLTVLIPVRNAIKNIQPTLDKIERMASILKPAENINLIDIEDVIDIEEQKFQSN